MEVEELIGNILQRLSDLIGTYGGTYRIVYRVLQPLLDVLGSLAATIR